MTDVQEESLLSRRPDLFNIRLINHENQDVVYIEDGKQTLTLEIKNTIEEIIDLLSDTPDPSHYTFALQFRPGIIKYDAKNLPTLNQDGDGRGFDFLLEEKDDGSVVFYFKCKKTFGNPYSFKPQQVISLSIENIVFDGTGGTRSSAALFEFQNILYRTNNESIKSERIVNFSIIDHRGKKHIPVHASCPNGNIILNNGTPNSITVRLANIFEKDIVFSADNDTKSKIKIVFEKDIFKTQPNIKAPSGWSATLEEQGGEYSYILSPDNKDFSLLGKTYNDALFIKNGYLDIQISDLITTNPPKETYISIRYQNIQNYIPGEILLALKIQPLIYNGNNVGIGTKSDKDQALYVFGNATIKDQMTICQKLEVHGDTDIQASVKIKESLTADRYVARGHISLYSYDGSGKDGTAYIMAHDSSKDVKLGMTLRVQPSANKYINALQIQPSGSIIAEKDFITKSSLKYDGDFIGRGHILLYPQEGRDKNGTAYIQARDDDSNVDIGMNLRVQKKGQKGREMTDAVRIDASGNVAVAKDLSIKSSLKYDENLIGRGHLLLYSYEGKGKDGTAYIQARDDDSNVNIGMNLRVQKKGQKGREVTDAVRIDASGNVVVSSSFSVDGKGGVSSNRINASEWAILKKIVSSRVLKAIANGESIRIEASGSAAKHSGRANFLDNPDHRHDSVNFADRATETTKMKLVTA